MKTRVTHLFALATLSLLFTSCQKGSLVENITPESIFKESIETRSSSNAIEFQIWQNIEVVKLNLPFAPVAARYTEVDEIVKSKTAAYSGQYGLSSEVGQGFMTHFGRFLSSLDMEYDPINGTLDGTVSLKFVAEGDMMVLKTNGTVTKKEATDGGESVTVQVSSIKGSGRYSNIHFYGSLTITESNLIFNEDAVDYNATLVVKGAFGK